MVLHRKIFLNCRVCLTNVLDPICARVRRVSAVGDRTQGLHAELSHQLLREVMKAVVAVQSGFVLADGATFETSKLPSTAVPVHNISVCHFCFQRRLLLFHKLSKLVVVLADVEGEGISVRQQFSADFALVLGIAIACQDFFLVMHCDEVEIEQVLVLGFLITEVTREDFR